MARKSDISGYYEIYLAPPAVTSASSTHSFSLLDFVTLGLLSYGS